VMFNVQSRVWRFDVSRFEVLAFRITVVGRTVHGPPDGIRTCVLRRGSVEDAHRGLSSNAGHAGREACEATDEEGLREEVAQDQACLFNKRGDSGVPLSRGDADSRCGSRNRAVRGRDDEADVEAFNSGDVQDQVAEPGAPSRVVPEHCRHKPFNPPLFHQGTIDNSADVLHLLFINMFASFLEFTALVHIQEFGAKAREPFEVYMRSIGIPIKCVKANSVTEMKQSLTGRDAKVVISAALEHIPTILEFAHAHEDEIEAEHRGEASGSPACSKADEETFDWEGDGEDEDEQELEDGEDEDAVARMLRDAKSWDSFARLVYSVRSFTSDSEDYYRKERAVECFNAAAEVLSEYKRLSPAAQSACPHVALCVLPRQMVEHGDPTRRGTDHSESYGAAIKDGIHRRCLRRKKATERSTHHRRDKEGKIVKTWTQAPLGVSRVMQTFRDQCVRERLIRDEESVPYLLRTHYRLAKTGFSTVGEAGARAVDPLQSIYERMAEGREFA